MFGKLYGRANCYQCGKVVTHRYGTSIIHRHGGKRWLTKA